MTTFRRKIGNKDLQKKLVTLDQLLLDLWLESDSSTEEKWERFVLLLESRADLVQFCRAQKVDLRPEDVLPSWLVKLLNREKSKRQKELNMDGPGKQKVRSIQQYVTFER